MLELLLCFALATGVYRAHRARHRWVALGGWLAVYLLLADTWSALAAVSHGPQPYHLVFVYMFLGPGAGPLREAAVLPLPPLLLVLPLVLRGLRALCTATCAWVCLRESSKLNPLLPRAYALDGIAMPFAGASVIDAVESVLLLWAVLMTGSDPF